MTADLSQLAANTARPGGKFPPFPNEKGTAIEKEENGGRRGLRRSRQDAIEILCRRSRVHPRSELRSRSAVHRVPAVSGIRGSTPAGRRGIVRHTEASHD